MSTRSTRRGKCSLLANITTIDNSYENNAVSEEILDIKSTRSRRHKGTPSFLIEKAPEPVTKQSRKALSEKNESETVAQIKNVSLLPTYQINTRSHREIDNVEVKSRRKTAGHKKNHNPIKEDTSNETNFEKDEEPVQHSRRTMRKNNNALCVEEMQKKQNEQLENDTDKENVTEKKNDKKKKKNNKRDKKKIVNDSPKSTDDSKTNEVVIVPSKRGSTDGMPNVSSKCSRTRKGIKLEQDNIIESIPQTIPTRNNRRGKSSSLGKSRESLESKNVVKSEVLLSETITISSPDDTPYHSINESSNFQSSILKEESFSSAKEFDVSDSKKKTSRTKKANKSKKRGKNSLKEKNSIIAKSESINNDPSLILNETYQVLVDDFMKSDTSLKTMHSPLLKNSMSEMPKFMSSSKNTLRISGIDEIPQIPIPENKRTLRRDRTFTKDTTDPNITLDLNKTVDISQGNNSLRRHVFSAASPCKLFGRLLSLSKDTSRIDNSINKTPPKTSCRAIAVGSAGCTPMPLVNKSLERNSEDSTRPDATPVKRSMLNVTRSGGKKTATPPLLDTTFNKSKSKVAFCSPSKKSQPGVANLNQIIKSNLKGSNKSFVLGNAASMTKGNTRKRSLTQNDTETREGKIRKLGIKEPNVIFNRINKPKTPISAGKNLYSGRANNTIYGITPAKSTVKLAAPMSRSKMPDFAALHRKQFDQMESLVQNKVRKEERAKQLLFPTTLSNGLKSATKPILKDDKPAPSVKKETNAGVMFTRFGFKLNTGEVLKFGANTETKSSPLPSVKYTKKSEARQAVMKEEKMSVVEKKRLENRNYVRGVRTNRRFELQMKARNLTN